MGKKKPTTKQQSPFPAPPTKKKKPKSSNKLLYQPTKQIPATPNHFYLTEKSNLKARKSI